MTKEEIKAFVEFRQAGMPVEDKNRVEALPQDGRDSIIIPGECRCGKSSCKREIGGLVGAAESLGCEDLAAVTHDEEVTEEERGHCVCIVPAWKWLVGER